MPKQKLTIELVPETIWNKSLAKLLPRNIWYSIREAHINNSGRRCEICGEIEGRMELHEIWSYDDIKHIQKLEGFILLCEMCHHVKHIGLAKILAKEGKLDFVKVVEHFCKLNNCDVSGFISLHNKAIRLWKERSKHEWKQDFGKYGECIR